MRLGVVGMLPQDFRTITPSHLETIRGLGLTGACFHGDGPTLFDIKPADCQQVQRLYADANMDLVQFGVGYRECLFDPDAAVRKQVITKIARGIEVACQLNAHACLIRTGSLNPAGSYAASKKNHESGCYERLIETLCTIADKAEQEGQTIVIETHILTIMNSPEVNAQVVKDVGSPRIQIVMDYVNHFQNLQQVFQSTERVNHIFDVMGPVCPLGHCKDIRIGNNLVLHIDEEVPGEGELDMVTVLRRWHQLRPDGYMLLEHLPDLPVAKAETGPVATLGWTPLENVPHQRYIQAARNVHRIAAEAGVPIY